MNITVVLTVRRTGGAGEDGGGVLQEAPLVEVSIYSWPSIARSPPFADLTNC